MWTMKRFIKNVLAFVVIFYILNIFKNTYLLDGRVWISHSHRDKHVHFEDSQTLTHPTDNLQVNTQRLMKERATEFKRSEFGPSTMPPKFIDDVVYDDTDNKTVLIHVAMSLCGNETNRTMEAVQMMKSAVLVTCKNNSIKIIFHIFSTQDARTLLDDHLQKWPNHIRALFAYRFIDTYYPDFPEFWMNMFQLCSTQRLFMAERLRNLDKILYIDSDSIVLGSLLPLWRMFEDFTDDTLVGMTDEALAEIGYYTLYKHFPHPGPYGMAAGLLMMHLANIRRAKWNAELKDIAIQQRQEKRNYIGDQDHLNEYVVRHPRALYRFPCIWNYRTDFCDKVEETCPEAREYGVAVLHGNRKIFHKPFIVISPDYTWIDPPTTTFRYVYNAFVKYDFTTDLKSGVLDKMKHSIEKDPQAQCYKARKNLYRQLEAMITNTTRLKDN